MILKLLKRDCIILKLELFYQKIDSKQRRVNGRWLLKKDLV